MGICHGSRTPGCPRNRWSPTRVAALLLALTFSPAVYANPTGAQVAAGGATFGSSGPNFTVTQTTSRTIINWQDFSIGAGETTTFVQPSALSAALNRVVSGSPSEIYGRLEANGQIYLINPNGILVGKFGTIKTQTFVGSTLDVTDQAFLDGGSILFSGASEEGIVNDGRIEAAGGDIYLISHRIENNGTLWNMDGTVGLAGGTEVILRPLDDEKLTVRLTLPGGSIDNRGYIQAARAELKAAGDNPAALAINHDGLIQALGTETVDGEVILSAGAGSVKIGGTTTVSNFDGTPGRIYMYSPDELRVGGHINAFGGGTVEAVSPERLYFYASVRAWGGNLLLESKSFDITDGLPSGPPYVSASALSTALNNLNQTNVIIHAYDPDGSGDISVLSELDIAGRYSLTLLAQGDIHVYRSIINSYEGAINLVAGWDGVTGYGQLGTVLGNGDLNIDAILGDMESFGNDGGSVFITSGSTGISVGSDSGTTTVAAADLTVAGGNLSDSYAQLGQSDQWPGSSNLVRILLQGSLEVSGGTGDRSFALVGNGGNANVDSVTGDIEIQADSIRLTGGEGKFSFAQIGHNATYLPDRGGAAPYEKTVLTGNIGIQANALEMTGGSGYGAFTQIGDGGALSYGKETGNISVNASYIDLEGGSNGAAYSQIGNGGFDTSGVGTFGIARYGAIAITAGDIRLQGGSDGTGAYAQIGPGGYQTGANENPGSSALSWKAGNFITADNIDVLGGAGAGAYAQIGPGGYGVDGTLSQSAGPIEVADRVRIVGGSGDQAYALVGLGGYGAEFEFGASPQILYADRLVVQGGSGSDAFATLGGAGKEIFIDSSKLGVEANDISVKGGSGSLAYAQIGYGGKQSRISVGFSDASELGIEHNEISLNGQNLHIRGGTGAGAFAMVGDGGLDNGSYMPACCSCCSMQIRTDLGINMDEVTVTGGIGEDAFAQIGSGGSGMASIILAGSLQIDTRTISITGGSGKNAYAQIGQGGLNGQGSVSGDIYVSAQVLALSGGDANGSYAQIGQGGLNFTGTYKNYGVYLPGELSGLIHVDAADVTLAGGGGDNAYAQIGHGGVLASGLYEGLVDLYAPASGSTLTLLGGSGRNAYAFIGNGAASSPGSGDRTDAGTHIYVNGETRLVDGTGPGAIWWIGSRTTGGEVTDEETWFSTRTLDTGSGAGTGGLVLSQAFIDRVSAMLKAGPLRIESLGTSLISTGDWNYAAPFELGLVSAGDMRIEGNVLNSFGGSAAAEKLVALKFGGTRGGVLDLKGTISAPAGEVAISGGGHDDVFNINTLFDATFAGAAGDDRFNLNGGLGAGSEGLTVSFDGGTGTDTILFEDSGDAGDGSYHIGAGILTKGGNAFAFAGIETITLHTGAGDDVVATESVPGVQQHLFGGDPDTFPGDTLLIGGIGAYGIDFAQFEQVNVQFLPGTGAAGTGELSLDEQLTRLLASLESETRVPVWTTSEDGQYVIVFGADGDFPWESLSSASSGEDEGEE